MAKKQKKPKSPKQPSKGKARKRKPRRAPVLSSKRIVVRMTPAEYGLLKKQANTLGIGLAECVRRLSLRGQR